MSIDLILSAEREVLVVKTGKKEVQSKSFHHLFSTGTKKTYEILAETDPIQAYKAHVRSLEYIEDEYIYDDDDVFLLVGTSVRFAISDR